MSLTSSIFNFKKVRIGLKIRKLELSPSLGFGSFGTGLPLHLLTVFKFGNWLIVGIVTVLRAASSKLRIPERIFCLGHSYNSYAALGNPPLCGGRICARQKQFGDKNLDKIQQHLSEDLHIILMIKDNHSHDDHNQALWDLIEHSESSKAAEIVSIISTAFVGISIVGMTVNTMPDLQYTVSSSLFIR